MTYPQASEAFRQVAATDPECAMAHWGIAMTLFQPLWPTRPGSEALKQGWDAAQKAKELQAPTEREQLFVAAAEAALEHPAGDKAQFVWDEFPHAIEYLVYAYLQKGADDGAAAQMQRLLATPSLEPTFKTAFHLASVPARYALERRAWGEAAMIVPRVPAILNWDRFAWPEAIAQFARGMGAAHLGKINDAKAAGERIEKLEAATRKAGEDLFARNIRVLLLELNAWLAHVEGQEDTGIALMREAAELEASTPKHAVTPGPTLPADELLGDLLMERAHPTEALAAYKRSMELYPKRFNGLLGAARAAHALGDKSQAGKFYHELLEVSEGGTRQPALKEAEDYVAQRR
jgi:tetratricopeptide (TPR) repeat protein